MAESELIEVIQLPSGEQMRKFRATDDNITYRRSDGTFLSPSVGEALEANANRQVDAKGTEREQARFSVEPKSEADRKELVETRYPQVDGVKGLNPERPKSASSQYEQNVMAWMQNSTVRNQIRQDPLVNNEQERTELLEARSRQLVDDLQSVKNEKEAMQVLRSYNIY